MLCVSFDHADYLLSIKKRACCHSYYGYSGPNVLISSGNTGTCRFYCIWWALVTIIYTFLFAALGTVSSRSIYRNVNSVSSSRVTRSISIWRQQLGWTAMFICTFSCPAHIYLFGRALVPGCVAYECLTIVFHWLASQLVSARWATSTNCISFLCAPCLLFIVARLESSMGVCILCSASCGLRPFLHVWTVSCSSPTDWCTSTAAWWGRLAVQSAMLPRWEVGGNCDYQGYSRFHYMHEMGPTLTSSSLSPKSDCKFWKYFHFFLANMAMVQHRVLRGTTSNKQDLR